MRLVDGGSLGNSRTNKETYDSYQHQAVAYCLVRFVHGRIIRNSRNKEAYY